ncbi:MAG TPA: GntR family transcriptional regulator [Prolixibacteraceae bacterium]|nr:GntR family transcriptional regulator [Prolixibacteraceae bacterium]HPR60204.1 GntR family transcriptional regulator [Prolixibacteraceae bacterium]
MSFQFNINPNSNSLKYIQLVDAIANSISEGSLAEGDMLPSVNELVKNASLSRDTIFKAYSELKNRGLVISVPNRGYFITKQLNRVLLILDTFKAYKEVLYDGFRSNLPETISVDLMFHHYNFNVFETIVNDSIGKYSHYIIMNFDHKRMREVISKIPSEKLLVVDWDVHASNEHSFVCQDFGLSVYNNFAKVADKIRAFMRFVMVYPQTWTYHPKITIDNYLKFCADYNIKPEIVYDAKKIDIQKGDLYFLVSDRTLTRILDQAHDRTLKIGSDVGIISYNDTPMKKYVEQGITALSTNFYEMGKLAAEYVLNPGEIRQIVPTELIMRKSF